MSTCTTASRDLDEPLAGTAATARTWLLLEQPGPWGAKALTSSHLDPALGRALEAAAEGTGVRIALIRRPGRHADCGTPAVRQVYVAHTVPGNVWLHSATTSEPERLLDLDFAALGRGDSHTFDSVLQGRPHTGDPLALVCTNGKRDRCCALLGRPLAAELSASGVGGVWEVTHLGGHRFSPTLLVLPFGYAYGRAQAPHVKEVLRGVREGRIVVDGCRGSSAWERPAQAAELAVRTAVREYAADALTVVRTDGAAPRWEVVVGHVDGRLWRVVVAQGASLPPRPESCGSALGSPARMDVVAVQELHLADAAGPVRC
ncbi:sucrase/ferredoxin-like family protein [Streptomyces yaanensis]|uniref:Sucrase/ferredoxin-like family protein n=1 Tax=Streptomyces yaanensis TaxID=1142239 RepID=A0ABV7SD76_9ACTN|nr:sucrase/ferredoxin-like family protein [Streptomyces sp. CGMCC 4.7035]WNB98286.1 sucrase/ferredoxin-like family protein [Streptomyces sp. CGMCC 4.7035]